MIMIQVSADRKCTVNKLNSRWTLYQNKLIKKLYLNWRGVISSDPFKRRHNCGYKYICTSVQVKLLHASMSITLLSFYRAIKFDARLPQACSNSKSKYTYFIGLKILVMFCSVHFKTVIYYKSLVQVSNKNFKIWALSAFSNTEYEIYQDVVDM